LHSTDKGGKHSREQAAESKQEHGPRKHAGKPRTKHIKTKVTPLKYRRDSLADQAQELIVPFLSDLDDNMGPVIEHSIPLSDHSHEKGHEENVNVRAAMIHIIGDILQSIGVLIAAGVIFFWPSLTICDPICTFVFSIIVMFTTVPIVKDCIRVLMEGTPHGLDMEKMTGDFKLVEALTNS